jgi:hypothetical protein
MDRIEYEEKREWLRNNPDGFRAAGVRKALRAYEREHGKALTKSAPRRTAARGYVVIFHDRPGQPRGGRVVHSDYACPRRYHDDADIREATPDELERSSWCKRCS